MVQTNCVLVLLFNGRLVDGTTCPFLEVQLWLFTTWTKQVIMYNMGCFFLVQQKGYVTTLQETNNNKYEQLVVARTNVVNNII